MKSLADDSFADHTEKVREILKWRSDEYPFAELPENIQIQMNALRSEYSQAGNRLRDLAASLTELYKTNKVESTKQGRYARWSIILGVAGIVTGAIFSLKSS